ncbi:hypothetical protein MRB53_026269 [Persea americana]|uniref:Uncharacterized protein n=1 Tax=Persea americana TaxID=3435 RepID=A0ACC2LHW1_PERAE|nr:hypothetical protein MRB53_026269 [Persea americana]
MSGVGPTRKDRVFPFCLPVPKNKLQGMEASYVELAARFSGSGIKVGKFQADGDQKAFAKNELQLGNFPTIPFFPKHASQPIKYPFEKHDVVSLLAFVKALH